MADSIIAPGSQARRDRRRQGWMQPFNKQDDYGTPGLSGTIDSMESMDLSDSAQGWDISDAAPPIRPSAIRMAAYQQGGEEEGGAPVRFANMTEDDASEVQPTQNVVVSQQPARCTGPNCQKQQGFGGIGQPQIISERVTKINGVPVEQLGAAGATQPMATASPDTVGPPAPTGGDDYVAALLLNPDLDQLNVGPQVRALAKVAKTKYDEAARFPVTPETKGNYVPYALRRKEAEAAYNEAVKTINTARAMQASSVREKQIAANLEIARKRMQSDSYAGSLDEINGALARTSEPIEVRVLAITSSLTDQYEAQKAAVLKRHGDPSTVTAPEIDKLAFGLRAMAAAHDIGEAYVRHISLRSSNDPPASIADLPMAVSAFRAAYPTAQDMHSIAGVERLMAPAIAQRIATYNWTAQHGTDIAEGRVPAKPDEATMGRADKEARAILQRLWNNSLPPQTGPSQPSRPQQGSSQPQPSGTTPQGGTMLGNPGMTFRLGE